MVKVEAIKGEGPKQVLAALSQDSKEIALPRAEWGNYNIFGTLGYNGEKNPGEIGPIRDYTIDYNGLRARSWQAFIENSVLKMVINKYVEWVIGDGLKLQSEPAIDVLKDSNIRIDKQKWSRQVEARFRLFAKSRMSDWADMTPLSMMEAEAYKNCEVGGDVLVLLRFDSTDRCVKTQLIDGAHVQSPRGVNLFPLVLENGNRVFNGVEVDARGRHIAYHVRKPTENGLFGETQRIPARGYSTNALMAYMVYGNKYRIDSYRGMPLASVVLETLKKLDRYKEATVGGAEERQKIAYFFEHDIGSKGDDPLTTATMVARDFSYGENGQRLVPVDDFGDQLAVKVQSTTGKMTFNMGQGSKVNAMDAAQEISFKEFYEALVKEVCAALDIPYEVAVAVYGNNYSASRAAIKQWEQTMLVKRAHFATQFLQPIYDFWLECEILTMKISAPGYLRALLYTEDRMILEAFRGARFVGPSVPHIDPEKEVKAIRAKLGIAGDAMPLMNLEDATEAVGSGDSDSNLEQFAEELKTSKKLGIKIEVPPPGGQAGKPTKPAKRETG